jgi:hypothetical protein
MNFNTALPPSFLEAYSLPAGSIPGIDTSSIPLYDIDFNAPSSADFSAFYSGNFNLSNSVQDAGWSFITAPENISWDVANQATRIDIFGTNNPPVVAGSRGMRDLSLGNSLVEGFVRGVTVEGKIAALERLMNYKLNQTDGFVSVPVYQVTANDKVYGNGYFIIRDIKINEKMRDIKGDTTRAYVDISLMEVPEYQVNSGRDQASKVAAAVTSILPTRTTGANGGNLGVGQSGSKAGANSASASSSSNTDKRKGDQGPGGLSAFDLSIR